MRTEKNIKYKRTWGYNLHLRYTYVPTYKNRPVGSVLETFHLCRNGFNFSSLVYFLVEKKIL